MLLESLDWTHNEHAMQLHIPVQVAWHQQGRSSLTCLRTATCTNNGITRRPSELQPPTYQAVQGLCNFFPSRSAASIKVKCQQVLLIFVFNLLSLLHQLVLLYPCFFCKFNQTKKTNNKQACLNMSPFEQEFKQMRHLLRFKKEQPSIWSEMLQASMFVWRLGLDHFFNESRSQQQRLSKDGSSFKDLERDLSWVQHAFCNKAHQSLYMVKCVLTPQVIYKLFGASTLNISKLLNICLNAALQALHAMGSLVAEICMEPLAMPQWTAVCALLNVRGPTNSRKPTSWSLSIGPHLKVCSTSWHYLAMWIGLC